MEWTFLASSETNANDHISSSPSHRRQVNDGNHRSLQNSDLNNENDFSNIEQREKNSADIISMEELVPNTGEISRNDPPILSDISARRRGHRAEDKALSKKVRSFYKKQDNVISSFEQAEHFSDKNNDDENGKEKSRNTLKHNRKYVSYLTKLSLAVNISLLMAKLTAAIMSKSLSVISSVVDSVVDLASSVILFWATRAIKRRDPFQYPQGRTRLEPIAIVILSIIMCLTSVQVIRESAGTMVTDISSLKKNSTSNTGLHEILMTPIPIAIMCATILSKLILFILCRRVANPTLNALGQDHRNDVFSNIIALVCGLVGSHAYKTVSIHALILTDPIGAIIISLFILVSWWRQAKQQVQRLSGHTAKPEFLQQITWIAFNHSPLITKIDTVRAFYFGTYFLVEVDIVLPETMSLKEAHDIGEDLQKKIESVPEVERAFVHLDYEFNHKASDEHKIV
ncbi:unnamed protein product [Didymodactylos carnosus]|uniref:Cation efflux protein cytoplasmic domain-containing protein n=1 Tax=Didymodactylos carnosus TaxID=1234261 RepID=A0A8S2CY65_9BILA|nr:unnamed protein product [Didymodactylos carnosus]CAF3617523.1 unnamed protein product [Didymodactylos carnosus]